MLRRPLAVAAALVALAPAACASSPTSSAHSQPTGPGRTTTTACTGQNLTTWSTGRLAAETLVVSTQETDVAAAGPAVAQGAGGIILFGSSAPADLGSELGSLEASAPDGITPLVMTDEEGGGVQRVANLVGNMPWPRTMAQTMTTGQVQQLASTVGAAMRAAGITMDLAPVLDLASGPGPDATHTDGPRSFSDDPATATAYGLAFARGLEAAGVVPVVKHFPGEGSATANTDDAPAATPPLSTLESSDLKPFEQAVAAGLPAVMVGNATVPGLTTEPASLSPSVVTGLLRDQLGFHGLVLTDSLSAVAISAAGYSVPAAAVAALKAGADLILFDADDASSEVTLFDQVLAAVTTAADDGQLPIGRLRQAAGDVLDADHVVVCPEARS